MKIQVLKGATSLITHIFVQDSSSTTGAGLTALTNATCGTFYWMRPDKTASTSATINSITTLGTYAGSATNAAFKEVDATNMPGVYELHWPNNAVASGANQVLGILKGATNAAPLPIELQLTSYDPNDSVRMGMTALPNASAAATGGLPTVDANNAVKLQSGSGANQILLSAGAVTVGTNNDKTGYSLASLDSFVQQSGTAQAGAAGTITLAAGASATDSLYNGQTVKIYSGTGAGQTRVILSYVGSTKVATVDRNWITNPDATSVYAVLSSSNPKLDSSLQVTAASVQGNVTGSVASVTGAVGSVTGNVGGNVVGSVGSVTGAVGSVTGNVGGNVVGSVASVTNPVTVGTNNDKSGYSLASLDSIVQQSGTAQAGAAGSITLAAGASATDNLYNGQTVKIYSGTGAGQTRVITGYTGSTKVATVDRNWITNPDATSVYAVLSTSNPKLDSSLQVTAASVQGNVTGSVASVTGAVTVGTNNDKTGYALTSGERSSISTTVWSEALPGSYTSGQAGFKLNAAGSASDPWSTALPGSYGAGTAGDIIGNKVPAIKTVTDKFAFTTPNQVDARVLTNSDKTGYSLAALDSFVQQNGTAQAGAAGSITLAAGASATDSLYSGLIVKIYSGTGAGQARVITGYTGATKVATVDRNWITNPDSTSVYAVLAIEAAKIDSSLQVTAASVQGNVTGSVASVTGAVGSVTGNVGGNVVGSAASVTGAVGSVTGNVGGNVVGSVASVTNPVTVGTNNDKAAYSLTSGERTSIADAIFTRDLSAIAGEARRSLLNAIRKLINKFSVSGTTLTVYKEDQTTSAYTETVSQDATAQPITGSSG